MRGISVYLVGLTILSQIVMSCGNVTKPKKRINQTADTISIKSHEPKQPKLDWPNPEDVGKFFIKYSDNHKETKVLLKTRLGEIEIELFEDTPLHRANFLFNISRGLYYKTIFYRVVPEFMIQGGNSDNDKTVQSREHAGAYYIPNEALPNHIHERGAVAMAMSYDNNPEMKSAQYSFYIVIGRPFTEKGLKATEDEYDMKVPLENRQTYLTIGGSPHLDGKHTVFGKVIKGMDVVEAIAAEKRDSGDWPVNDVVIEYKILN